MQRKRATLRDGTVTRLPLAISANPSGVSPSLCERTCHYGGI